MPKERYYIPSPLTAQSEVEVAGSEFHHLSHVMRNGKGGLVELVNGAGALAQARILQISKEKARLLIEAVTQEEATLPRLILAQAIPQPQRLDAILEKGTELGVDGFWLFGGDRSSRQELTPHQLERAKALTIAAMKQCGRTFLPAILPTAPLKSWPPFKETAFFGDLRPDTPQLALVFKKQPHPAPFIFFNGPESGFSEEELALLSAKGAMGVSLHPLTLRTDTAAIAALSILHHLQQ